VEPVLKDPRTRSTRNERYSPQLFLRSEQPRGAEKKLGRPGVFSRVTSSAVSRNLKAASRPIPQSSYVAQLYAKGLDAILKRWRREAAETIMARKDGVGKKSSTRPPTCGSFAGPAAQQASIPTRSSTSWPGAKACQGLAEKAARKKTHERRLYFLQDRGGEIPCRKIYEGRRCPRVS